MWVRIAWFSLLEHAKQKVNPCTDWLCCYRTGVHFVDKTALELQVVCLLWSCMQPCLRHVPVRNFNVLLTFFFFFLRKAFKICSVALFTSQQYCTPPCTGWACLPALQNLYWGQSCHWIERCRVRPTASQGLVFGEVNFLTIRNALKDINGLIQFTFNLHSSIYTRDICKHYGLVCVHV